MYMYTMRYDMIQYGSGACLSAVDNLLGGARDFGSGAPRPGPDCPPSKVVVSFPSGCRRGAVAGVHRMSFCATSNTLNQTLSLSDKRLSANLSVMSAKCASVRTSAAH